MEGMDFPSDQQLDLLSNKVNVKKEIKISGLDLELKNMDSYEEYMQARPIVEGVTRTYVYHSKDYVDSMLTNTLYYPFVIKLASESGGRPEVIAYFEIYLMPHLGRFFDSRLERVFVLPKYRMHGIFNSMMEFVIEFCKSTLKCNRIDLTSENSVAIRVYESLDFEKVDTSCYRKYLSGGSCRKPVP